MFDKLTVHNVQKLFILDRKSGFFILRCPLKDEISNLLVAVLELETITAWFHKGGTTVTFKTHEFYSAYHPAEVQPLRVRRILGTNCLIDHMVCSQ